MFWNTSQNNVKDTLIPLVDYQQCCVWYVLDGPQYFVLSCLLLCIHFSEDFNLNLLQSYRWHECNMVSAIETQKRARLEVDGKEQSKTKLIYLSFCLSYCFWYRFHIVALIRCPRCDTQIIFIDGYIYLGVLQVQGWSISAIDETRF